MRKNAVEEFQISKRHGDFFYFSQCVLERKKYVLGKQIS